MEVLVFLFALLIFGFLGAPLVLWTALAAGFLYFQDASLWIWIPFGALALLFNVPPLRASLVSKGIVHLFKKFEFIPKISQTERTALDAGVVWVEKDLFSGRPDFKKLMKESYPQLSQEEQAFINGPCEELCRMIDAWKIYRTRDLSPQVWEFIKKEKFLGMIIPKEYGGLGFSALAHSEVIQKLSARSLSVGITVMVPNSLGPAELINHYGTDEQKKRLLPRLAAGAEIPCFGLTEPMAGSDAGSMTSNGVLFKGEDGKLYIRLNWNKRYITLASISTIVGLGFRLRDPENLLGSGEDVGITCALIPSNTKGVVLGRRHDPLSVPFVNCPTQGHDVVISVEAVVGGVAGCGKGWGMLMESLAAGRGISLPAQSTGGAKLAYWVVSAHALIRKQFGVNIGAFEGIEEPMAKIGSVAYALEAMRRYTCGALDKGIKPPVITAMQKYYSTELARIATIHGMDVMGGNGISLGPRNLLGEIYMATPIGITVEGANIMTRTLIIFGQGALRAHPYAYAEVKALESDDLKGFDKAFWGHVGHIVRNFSRSIVLSLSRGYLSTTPDCHPKLKVYFRRLNWASATFAILADVAMGVLGGSLKLKEKLTGRFADVLSYMYIATSVLRRFEAEGRKEADLAFVHYTLKNAFVEIQKAFDGIFDNLKIPGLRWFFKGWMGAWSRINSMGSQASDGWSHAIAHSMMHNPDQRARMTTGIYVGTDRREQTGRMEYAYQTVLKSIAIEQKIREAVRDKVLPKKKVALLIQEAFDKKVISQAELSLLKEAEEVRYDAVLVDDFSQEEYLSRN